MPAIDETTYVWSTTTLFAAPSIVPEPSEDPGPRVPVAAIAGGVVAGAVLAIAVTIGWIWWGRSLNRSAAKHRREEATRYNTLRNANISRPRVHTRYRPLYPRPVEKQVKFVNADGGGGGGGPGMVQLPAPAPTRGQRFRAMTRINTGSEASDTREAGHLRAPGIVHQTSKQTMSSASQYSTASGEEHQIRAPSNLLLAALGRNSSATDNAMNDDNSRSRWSWSSSLGIFTRHNRNARAGQRSSQFTEYSNTTDGSGRVVPMGVAL